MCWSRMKEEIARSIEMQGRLQAVFGEAIRIDGQGIVPSTTQIIVPVSVKEAEPDGGAATPLGFIQEMGPSVIFQAVDMPSGMVLAENADEAARTEFMKSFHSILDSKSRMN